ncbi:hypothetical protein ACFTAO_16145 [Paenibacillus rhizoplanae]
MKTHIKLGRKSALLLGTTILLVTTALSGCSGNSNNGGAAAGTAEPGTPAESSDPGTSKGIDHSKPLTITVFDNAANYQGEQTGWYGKLLKDKFNITLNILAPQVAGDQLYKTRSASGDLGDLLIIENSQLEELIPAGMIMDLTDMIKNTEHLSQYVDNHFKPFNVAFEKQNPDGKNLCPPGLHRRHFSNHLFGRAALLQPDYALGLLQGNWRAEAE